MNKLDVAIIDGLKDNLNNTQIAEMLNCSGRTVSYRIKKMRDRGIDIPQKKMGRKNKTDNDEIDNEIVQLLAEGMSTKEIANKMGVKYQNIAYRIKMMMKRGTEINIKDANQRKIDNQEIDIKILELLRSGLSQNEIAKKLGIRSGFVTYRAKRMREQGIEIAKVRGRGKKTINDEIDDKILELLAEGFDKKQIAAKLCYTVPAISYRLNRMEERGIKTNQNVKRRKRKSNKEKKCDCSQQGQSGKRKVNDYVIAEQIIKLMKTKNASAEQVRVLACIYNVDIEGLLKYVEEQDR